MFRTLLLILFLCVLTAFSVVLEYRARAATYTCSPRGTCVRVKPPDCVIPDCQVMRPLLRVSCERAWREHLMKTGVRSPQLPCFVFEDDKLQTVARVSTLDIMRAIGQYPLPALIRWEG